MGDFGEVLGMEKPEKIKAQVSKQGTDLDEENRTA